MKELIKIDELDELNKEIEDKLKLVDDIVLKNYISSLEELEIITLDEELKENNIIDKVRLFNITKMVYKKDEVNSYKFASIFNAVANTNSSLITIINSNGKDTKFYLGIRNLMEKENTETSFKVLEKSIQGQFPGIKIETLKNNEIEKLLKNIDSKSVASVSCVANNKNKNFIDDKKYLQDLEKLALAMQGEIYSAIIIANPLSQKELKNVRKSYEDMYTNIAPFSNIVLNYGKNSSTTDTTSMSNTETYGTSKGRNINITKGSSVSKNIGEVISISEQSKKGKIVSIIGGALTIAGGIVALGSIGIMGGAVIIASSAFNKNITRTSGGENKNKSKSNTTGKTWSENESNSYTSSTSKVISDGDSQSTQYTKQNKTVLTMLERIDNQLKRVSEFESIGMWECAAYFLSPSLNSSTIGAATYKSLVTGENTGLEVSAINTWTENKEKKFDKNNLIVEYIKNLMHPLFIYKNNSGFNIEVSPAILVSSNELAIHMGLPRNSVPGFPVVEHIDFGKEIVKYDSNDESKKISLGNIFNMGKVIEENKVELDLESLSMHTFISGATGSGKSNTIYHLLNKLIIEDIKFMVIEPAKGEYKKVLGHRKDVRVFGTNPNLTELLHINPFRFPKEIHVLEHIDRLIEIFNVCWPMYAAMPAILKEAIIQAYRKCGWDLDLSINFKNDNFFPTFIDLLEELKNVIKLSEYSEEVKSNYIGSLTTRVKSLTNGLNGQIFSSNEINNEILFDTNVIVDLSRVGSQETKSLLMGVLVMRLSEHRMATSKTSNRKLHHVTVLEEAHNILRAKNSASSVEGSNVAEKAVEMISNAIAEMRTYGEGFIIVDQSPSAVDISAIRNTNTKIIMRLPEENDRKIAGKSAALKEEQINEIARLPKGVAVVYQNDWIEAVLCQINKFDGEEKDYHYRDKEIYNEKKKINSTLINFILNNRLDSPDKIDLKEVEDAIENFEGSTQLKIELILLLKQYRKNGKLKLWQSDEEKANLFKQSVIVKNILELDDVVKEFRYKTFSVQEPDHILNTLIAQKLEDFNTSILLEIKECLVRSYLDIHRNISELEFDTLRKNIIQL
ncbi:MULTISPECIES: ATP-binding protein [Fusobacterium]|uniref:ATP-binding protein n=1 Tax=Fusobacterium TaxID=848 RepID=UPI0022E0FA2B|nr:MULTISPECIES: ATP-binding protein [Fusobacterium]